MENGRCSAASYGSATLRTFPTIAAQNKKAIVFASLHQRWLRIGAADEARTRYLHLGKVALYQMSYGRISGAFIPAPSRAILANFGVPAKACGARFCGEKEKIWYSSQKSCLQDFPMNDRIFDVVPPIGIEPMTRGFSVPCSTDCATEANTTRIGLEPTTPSVTGWCSNQLSYRAIWWKLTGSNR